MRSLERCSCGDPACPWCGPAQGYDPEAERAKAKRELRRREVITPEEAVARIARNLTYYVGQVWTAEMAEERARNLVCWLQLTRIARRKP